MKKSYRREFESHKRVFRATRRARIASKQAALNG